MAKHQSSKPDPKVGSPEPWPEQVDGAALLSEISITFRRFIIMSPAAADACALWVVFTHAFDAAMVAPKLVIRSPDKRSGKSRLIELLGYMVAKPLALSGVTAASLFRVIDLLRPTLLLDEADRYLGDKADLIAIINSGFTHQTAKVLRNAKSGDDWTPKVYSTFAPQAIAGIGSPPDTILDRSVVIDLKRKLRSEQVEKLRYRDAEPVMALGRKSARFAQDNLERIREPVSRMPEGLSDRATDGWEILISIADVAGGDWPERARAAALTLARDGVVEDESDGAMLLADIRCAFDEAGTDRLKSAQIVEYLKIQEDRPWPEWRTGRPITANGVARLLKPFKIRSGSIRVGTDTGKGYYRAAFTDAFDRYLPPPDAEDVTTAQPRHSGDFGGVEPAQKPSHPQPEASQPPVDEKQ